MNDDPSSTPGPPGRRPVGPPGRLTPDENGDKKNARQPGRPPKPSIHYVPVDTGASHESTWKTWAVVLILIGAMIGAYVHIKKRLVPTAESGQTVEEQQSEPRARKKHARQGTPSRRKQRVEKETSQSDPVGYYEDEEFWDDDELETNDRFRLGDIREDRQMVSERVQKRRVDPEFVPPPDWYKPDGPYTPTSRWTKPGTSAHDVVEMNMQGDSTSPLEPSQIERILNERKLMPCYREVAQKVPAMRGRVDLDVWIEQDGRVSHVRIKRSELRSKKVEDCIVKTVRSLKFAPTDGRRTSFSTHFDFD